VSASATRNNKESKKEEEDLNNGWINEIYGK